MILSAEQRVAVEAKGNVVVTACPGSGKTRVLTARVLRGLGEIRDRKQRVIALTYTNRAADEIEHRIDSLNEPTNQLWSGTIHSFALEWILRPYAPYSARLKHGFTLADEYQAERLFEEARKAHTTERYLEVAMNWPRTGVNPNEGIAAQVFQGYKDKLQAEKLLDYDDVLFLAYKILRDNSEVRETLASIMPLICVDEVQDIQDMQFAILSQIVQGENKKNTLFFVGDSNQSIYESLGAMAKSPSEIATEFGLNKITHLKLSENYRSTQRIADHFTLFRPATGALTAVAPYAGEVGEIKFFNQSVDVRGIAHLISEIIRDKIAAGISPSDICVIAPWWAHVRPLARELVTNLPAVDFDAPGLSPLHSKYDDIWFKLARLFLSGIRPGHDKTRHRWATNIIESFELAAAIEFPESLRNARGLLRFVNSVVSGHTDGIPFLKEAFEQFVGAAGIDLKAQPVLLVSQDAFFAKAEERIAESDGAMPTTVAGLRKLFRSPAGVVVNTCHGVKGEEYHTVIAFGLLKGLVPNWSVVRARSQEEADENASKLLYVICSRAKRSLFLIAESGRYTQSRRPYVTTNLLQQIQFDYD